MDGLATDIYGLFKERRSDRADIQTQQVRIRDVYNGKLEIDLPELDGRKPPPVPNLLAQGVDQMAGRIASTIPVISVVPDSDSRRSVRRAQTAARVLGGYWAADKLPLKMTERARHLTAYGMGAVQMGWNFKEHRPKWTIRDPLTTFASTEINATEQVPNNVIFGFYRSIGWLKSMGYKYPVRERDPYPEDTQVPLLEYLDDDVRAIVGIWDNEIGGAAPVLLDWTEHGLGFTPATVTQRIGLDVLNGQFDQMLSMYEAQARLMALDLIAVEKGVFPDTWLISRPGELANIIDGPHDGRSGKVNIAQGGDLRTEAFAPGYQTGPTIDRLERNQRVDAGIPPEFGGESGTNIRTGRRGDAVLSAVIDMPIAYAQNLLATALEAENEMAAKMAKKYDGNTTRTLVKGLANSDRPVKYDAATVFENHVSSVSYPAQGADVNALVVGLGQRVGLGILSKQSAADLDPWVDNPELEKDRITAEGLETALLTSVQQQASQGAIPPMVLARIIELVRTDQKELPGAIKQAAEEYQKKQAEEQAAAQQGQQGPPSAEAMAAGPGAAALTGNPEAASPIPGLGSGMSDLTSMLGSLRMPTQGLAPSVGVEGRV